MELGHNNDTALELVKVLLMSFVPILQDYIVMLKLVYWRCCYVYRGIVSSHTHIAGTVSSLPQWDSSSYVSTTAPTSSVTACKEELRQSEGGTDTSVLTWYCRTGVDCAVNTLCFQVLRHVVHSCTLRGMCIILEFICAPDKLAIKF